MIFLYIFLSIIGLLAICFFAWLYFLSKPASMSLTEMNERVRALRKTYRSFTELERNSLTGRQVLKSVKYLEAEILKVSSYA